MKAYSLAGVIMQNFADIGLDEFPVVNLSENVIAWVDPSGHYTFFNAKTGDFLRVEGSGDAYMKIVQSITFNRWY